MTVLARSVLSLASFCLLTACDVYHSSDRDYFNSNAIYGAPVATTSSLKAQIAQTKCQKIADQSVLLDLDLQTKDDSSAVSFLSPDGPKTDATVTLAHLRQRSPVDASVCAVKFKDVPNDASLSPLLIQAGQESVGSEL